MQTIGPGEPGRNSDPQHRGIHLVLTSEDNEARLFLGTQQAAEDATLLRHHTVMRIICVGTPAFHRGGADGFRYLEIPILDMPSENLLVHLDRCLSFIEDGMRQGKGVLVNCVFAQSRSASVVTAYIMRRKGLGVVEAMKEVRRAQPTILINPGFEAQLTLYYEMGCTLDVGKISSAVPTSRATYRWFLFANRINKGQRSFPGSAGEDREGFQPEGTGQKVRRYRCKDCRALLFSSLEVIDHLHPIVLAESDSVYESFRKHGDGSSWVAARDAADRARSFAGPSKKQNSSRAQLGKGSSIPRARVLVSGPMVASAPTACTSVFTEVLDWIGILDGNGRVAPGGGSSGKITCPGRKVGGCGSKLGTWSLEGKSCSCGRKVKPAVQFVLSRVEVV